MDFNSGMCYNPSAEYMEIVGKEEKFMQEQIPVRKVDTGKYMKIIRSLLEEGILVCGRRAGLYRRPD